MSQGPCSRAEIIKGGVFIPTSGIEQSWAIRDLVKAVPDLLTALQAVLDEPNDRNWAAAREAVRKATAS